MVFRHLRSGIRAPALVVLLLLSLGSACSAQTVSRPPTTQTPSKPSQTSKPSVNIDLGSIINTIDKLNKPKVPKPKRPNTLLIGDFVLKVEEYTNVGIENPAMQQIVGASGTAWLTFNCVSSLVVMPGIELSTITVDVKKMYSLEVVETVNDPMSQISLKDALRYRRDAKIGEKVQIEGAAQNARIQDARKISEAALGGLKPDAKGNVRVHFDDVAIVPEPGQPEDVGRIIAGSAAYPTKPATPKIIKLSLAGFTALIDVLMLTPDCATANIVLQLPKSLGAAGDCGPAKLVLGTVGITHDCQFYAERPGDAFGSWIIGNTGLVTSGTGWTADFNITQSPSGKPGNWMGVILDNGTASGSGNIPDPCNSGYLAAEYSYAGAEVTETGFAGQVECSAGIAFATVDPMGYRVGANGAELTIASSEISSGKLGSGTVAIPKIAVCKDADPTQRVEASFSQLLIQPDFDVSGQISFGSGVRLSWGELTHGGLESEVFWEATVKAGYLYLPAHPKSTFSPDTGAGFVSFQFDVDPSADIAAMESMGMSGIGIDQTNMSKIAIYSPDRPNGAANPIRMQYVRGWMRIGHRGLDGRLATDDYQANASVPMGNQPSDKRVGYVADRPFNASWNPPGTQKERSQIFEFCTSAAYHSRIDGSINLPTPCNIAGLAFSKMKVSSTANLLGGDVVLPTGGVTLDFWQLGLVPTGSPDQAGVVSVRTGRLIFTAAGITEPVHFAEPFRLTWGEMRAEGNLGELFFDYNPYGQRFDNLKYSPHNIALSKWSPGATNPYLATNGSVYINFFGSAFANIHDARDDSKPDPPFSKRYVTVPKTGESGWNPTDLHLHGEWDDIAGHDLVIMDFPDAQMGYNETIQRGFMGTGTTNVGFLHSGPLTATIEIHSDATDICMNSVETHDLDLGLVSAIGGLSHVSGCIRIEGPTMERMALGGYLEQSVSTGHGIVEPKAGYVVEVITCVTPSSFTFNAYGDMVMAVEGSAIDISGSVFLKYDYSADSAEGDIIARIDCNSAVAGLEGNGQVTWYIDKTSQYLQGRVGMTLCGWVGGAGMEGGIFVGHNAPRDKAWVLKSSNGCYGVSQAQLPTTLTGVYGYGSVGFGVQWYVFGGGVEIYAGMGVFSVIPSGASSAWGDYYGIGLPYVVGAAAVNVHGEILGGLVSASAWANLVLGGPAPITYEGTITLEGCVLWVFCGSVSATAGLGSDGFYMY